MLTIYHVPVTRSLRVLWLCEELELPHTVRTIDFGAAYRATPEWRRLNPVGKGPAMTDGGLAMCESGAVRQYRRDRYGQGRRRPEGGRAARGHRTGAARARSRRGAGHARRHRPAQRRVAPR